MEIQDLWIALWRSAFLGVLKPSTAAWVNINFSLIALKKLNNITVHTGRRGLVQDGLASVGYCKVLLQSFDATKYSVCERTHGTLACKWHTFIPGEEPGCLYWSKCTALLLEARSQFNSAIAALSAAIRTPTTCFSKQKS